jgi:hypothetical protein
MVPSSLVVMVCCTVATTVLVVSLILLKRVPAAPLKAFMLAVAVLKGDPATDKVQVVLRHTTENRADNKIYFISRIRNWILKI